MSRDFDAGFIDKSKPNKPIILRISNSVDFDKFEVEMETNTQDMINDEDKLSKFVQNWKKKQSDFNKANSFSKDSGSTPQAKSNPSKPTPQVAVYVDGDGNEFYGINEKQVNALVKVGYSKRRILEVMNAPEHNHLNEFERVQLMFKNQVHK